MTVCKSVLLAALVLGWTATADAQVSAVHVRAFSAHVVMPQARPIATPRTVEVAAVQVGVVIVNQVATTTVDVQLKNPSGSRVEAELLFPVPEGVAVRGFTFQGAGKEPSAELLPKAEALAAYHAIVAKVRDPALLEFAGYNLIRSSVFPVEAHGTQAVRLTYEHLLAADGDRVDYLLPRTESIDYKVPWEVSVKIQAREPIATVYSPSHKIEFQRAAKNVMLVKIPAQAMQEPGPLQLSYLRESPGRVTASLMAYPDPKIGGGYFLLLAGVPGRSAAEDASEARPTMRREVTVVLDRSGSMAGKKMTQVQAAAIQVIEALEEGEAFNVIDYSDWVSSFAPAPVVKDRKNSEAVRHYLRGLSASGGTNLHDALLEALRPKPREGMLPIVLFLTDGLPTVGVRSEAAIREAAEKGNTYRRRIFSFGVGYDVNAPLLSHLAQNSRAVSTFVLPNEEIEAKVSQIYRRLCGPVLAEPALDVVDAHGEPVARRVRDLLPGKLPDLFEGDQLVVLGKYVGDGPLHFRLQGRLEGKLKRFAFDFPLEKATVRNSFVPRLWASRKIGVLIDEIRQAGAAPTGPSVLSPSAATDPRTKELVDEIVRLSVEFGVLTEYTAFLAREGSDLSHRDDVLREANRNLVNRAQNTRSGMGAVNQAMNVESQRAQVQQNRLNAYYDENMIRVQTSRVQQVSDRGFFQQGNRWIDGNTLNSRAGNRPDRVVSVGSPEFVRLVERLAAENRQGMFSMSGEILVHIDGQNVLIK